jgi:hypothetical protein
VVDGIKDVLNVGIQHPPSCHQRGLHRPDRLPGVPLRAEPIGAVPKAGLKHRFYHELAGGLDHPVAHRRDTQRALPTVRLRNVHP